MTKARALSNGRPVKVLVETFSPRPNEIQSGEPSGVVYGVR